MRPLWRLNKVTRQVELLCQNCQTYVDNLDKHNCDKLLIARNKTLVMLQKQQLDWSISDRLLS